jgi:DNA-3-methyladenine glycosylase II
MTAAHEILQKDPILQHIIAQTPEYKKDFDAGQDVYLALLESIVSQQISVKAADAIFARIVQLFPDQYPHPAILLAKSEADLRSAGLSGQKVNYLRNVAEFALTQGIDYDQLQQKTDDEIVAYLTPIKGVGRWTVEMLLMFVLGRQDVFPYDDLVIRQKMMRAYGVDLSGKLLKIRLFEIAEAWRPYRSVACRYLWRWQPA